MSLVTTEAIARGYKVILNKLEQPIVQRTHKKIKCLCESKKGKLWLVFNFEINQFSEHSVS